jgi:hypothetical protein
MPENIVIKLALRGPEQEVYQAIAELKSNIQYDNLEVEVLTIDDTDRVLTDAGFQHQDTGGNCTAFVRTGEKFEDIITLEDDPNAPIYISDVCILGRRPLGDTGEYTVLATGTVEAILALDPGRL